MLSSVMATESFIVLTEDKNKEHLEEKKLQYHTILENDILIQSLASKAKFQAEIKKLESSYLLKVGPFEPDDVLAMVYLTLKKSFPHAFILEGAKAVFEPKPMVQTIEKKIYVDKKVFVEKEDEKLLIAVFSLAFGGFFFF